MKYVYGLNKSGLSIVNYFIKHNIPFVAWDDDKNVIKEALFKFKNLKIKKPNEVNLSKLEETYVTPGLDLKSKKLEIFKNNKIRMFRDLELYSSLISNQKVISITGTNGKSTTTKLIGDLIKRINNNCFVGGNIGKPLLDFKKVKKISRYHVIELSSFQLESAPSFKSTISILLNISNDHMDRYKNFDNYLCQKKKIINKDDYTYNIISVDDKYCLKIYKETKKINQNTIPISINKKIKKGVFIKDNYIIDNFFYKNRNLKIKKLSPALEGAFNLQNILATYVTSKILDINKNIFLQTIFDFQGLSHRLEKIFENKKILAINNSKATNLDSTVSSILNYDNIYLIFGGKIKERNFSKLIKFNKKIKKCYIIGKYSNIIFNEINKKIDSEICIDLKIAIKKIFNDIKSDKNKQTILLSPGCSSYDQYDNFEQRGKKFKKEIINNLKKL